MSTAKNLRISLVRASLVVITLVQQNAIGHSPDPITFWSSPKHGGNSFNEARPDEAYLKALRATGATWVRLTFSKSKGTGRDFLINDADNYTGLSKPEFAVLIRRSTPHTQRE